MAMLNRVRVLVGLCVLVTPACSIDVGGEEAVVNEEKRFPVKGDVELTLKTFDGAIEVRSWDRSEVLVRIERRAMNREDAEALEVQTSQDGNRIVVDARARNGLRRRDGFRFAFWRNPNVRLIVSAPRQITLDASTGDGPIEVGDLAGTITLRTGDGRVRAERLDGVVSVHTGDGAIEIADARGKVDLDTGDGRVGLTGRLEGLRIHTGDGPVNAEATDGSAMTGEWSITTGDGAVTLRLPSSFDADIDAESGDGRVTAEGVPGTATRDESDRGTLRGRLGKGGRVLRIRSGDGNIDIRR